jgi:D-alanyl-D-alanine carboxypeptidase
MTARRLSKIFAVAIVVLSVADFSTGVDADTANVPLPVTREWTAPMKHAISISRPGGISLAVRARIRDVATAIGAEAYPGRAAMVGLTLVRREEDVVQRVKRGMQVPMSVTVQPDEVVRNLLSAEAADALAAGGIVMGESSARYRGARVGDVVTLVGRRQRQLTFTIGFVADDEIVGGGDLLVSPQQADRLGATTITRYTVTGFRNPDTATSALAAAGFVNGMSYRVRRTWEGENPDATLGLGEAKLLVGEFAYSLSKSGAVTADPDWIRANITPRRFFDGIPVRAACHRRIWAPLQGALNEIKRAGLDDLIDVDNTNKYGGCFYPRLNRISGGLGYLSRHSWGMAFDLNTETNSQGRPPNLDCRIVRIFRAWGFAWGGNFTPADGMHFEYVGERRDNIEYPSKYCPNLVNRDR